VGTNDAFPGQETMGRNNRTNDAYYPTRNTRPRCLLLLMFYSPLGTCLISPRRLVKLGQYTFREVIKCVYTVRQRTWGPEARGPGLGQVIRDPYRENPFGLLQAFLPLRDRDTCLPPVVATSFSDGLHRGKSCQYLELGCNLSPDRPKYNGF